MFDKDPQSAAAKWYKGMKQKMVRLIFERKISGCAVLLTFPTEMISTCGVRW